MRRMLSLALVAGVLVALMVPQAAAAGQPGSWYYVCASGPGPLPNPTQGGLWRWDPQADAIDCGTDSFRGIRPGLTVA